MKVDFKDSFLRDLKTLKDADLLARIQHVLDEIENAASLQEISNLKKMRGGGSFYHVRIGDYRLGFSISSNTVTYVRCLHRREIYRNFP
ncbi:MAG: type II toxin-antitoxin system RelE family toxin [Janthinobacterium lividum]